MKGSIRKHEREGGARYEARVTFLDREGVRRERSRSFSRRRDAEKALRAMLGEVDRGEAVASSRTTVAALLQRWLDDEMLPRLKPKSAESYRRSVDRYLVPALGGVQAQRLSPGQVQATLAAMRREGTGDRTLQIVHQHLGQALRWAVGLELVGSNPVAKVRRPKATPKERAAWTPEQARAFLAVAEGSGYGPVWIVLLSTGMRRGEALGLRWRDVRGDEATIRQTVVAVGGRPTISEPKTRAGSRTVLLPPTVVAALRTHRAHQAEQRLAAGPHWQDHDLVFASATGAPINPSNLARDFHRWVRAAGVPRIPIHGLRHTFVSLGLAAGVPIRDMAGAVGHSRPSVTLDVYGHLLGRSGVTDRVAAALEGQGDPTEPPV